MADNTIRIMVTGGAGFLATAIYHRLEQAIDMAGGVRRARDYRFIGLSRDDEKQARVQVKAQRFGRDVAMIRYDVTNPDWQILAQHMRDVDIVIHAAANKHVDRSELAVWETVRTNVDGSRHVALAAVAAGVDMVIGVSTDKACEPVNTYGLTKSTMERIFTEANGWRSDTRFACVRYGNVVSSTGSVIPLFRRQALEQGEITVTDPGMTRYFMPIDDAVQVIAKAIVDIDSVAGGVLIPGWLQKLRMGNVADIVASHVAQSLSSRPKVRYIGHRPGEKMHESLLSQREASRAQALTPGYVVYYPTAAADPDGQVPPMSSAGAPAMHAETLWRAVTQSERYEL